MIATLDLCRAISVIVALAASNAVSARAMAEEIVTATGIPAIGVRHEIWALLGLDADSPYGRTAAPTLRGDLRAIIRLSDHAPDADFFGTVVATFSDVDPREAPPEQKIWEDSRCHRERGWPKMTVLGIDGVMTQDEAKDLISAVPRHIGLHVPDDEILVSRLSFDTHGKGVGDFVIRAQTKQTRLHVDFRLSALPCTL
jgi:hypothetical protein